MIRSGRAALAQSGNPSSERIMPRQRNERAIKHLAFALAVSSLAVGPAGAQKAAAPAGNVDNGKTLYFQVGCYECHGFAGQGAMMTGPRVSRTEFPFDSFLFQL